MTATATLEAPAAATPATPASAPATPPAPPAEPAATQPATDWRSALPAELQSHEAFKDFKGIEDLAKGYVAAQDWKAGLPDDLKKSPATEKFKTPADLLKSYIELEVYRNAKGIIKPNKDARPEEWDAFYNALGRPETPDKYQVPKENMPQDAPLDDAILKEFSGEAHKLGLTSAQYAELVRFQANKVAQANEAFAKQLETQRSEADATLRKEWGAAYDQNINLAKAGAKYAVGDKFEEIFGAIANDPAALKGFAKIGRELSDDPIVGGGGNQNFILTPKEAQFRGNDIISNKDNPKHAAYHNPKDPNHAAVAAEVRQLFAAGYPDPKQQ